MEIEVAVEDTLADGVIIGAVVEARRTISLVSDAVLARVLRTYFGIVLYVIVKRVGDKGMMLGVRHVRTTAD